VIARAGKPVVRLEPVQARRLEIGFVEVTLPDGFFEPMTDEELAEWE
jgi:hypothetical protein